jgi:hypothetical protein
MAAIFLGARMDDLLACDEDAPEAEMVEEFMLVRELIAKPIGLVWADALDIQSEHLEGAIGYQQPGQT